MPGNSTGQENLKGKKSHWGNVDEVIEDNCTEGNFILVYHKFTPYDYYDNALYVQHLSFAKKQNIAWRGKRLSIPLLRAGATMAAAIVLVWLAYCSFNSLGYRTQL